MRALLILLFGIGIAAASADCGAGGIETALRAEIRTLPAPEEGSGAPVTASPGIPSSKKAFLLSLVVPGLGQFYGSGWDVTSWTSARATAYAGFEVFAWMQESHYRDLAWDKEDEYRAYADTNWHWREHCSDWNGGDGAVTNDPFVYEPGLEDDVYLTTDPEMLEFYEDIHKLQKWICGWDDYLTDGELVNPESGIWHTPMQIYYRGMREESNDFFSTADHWRMGIIMNHIVSAFDALLSTRRAASLAEGDAPSNISLHLGTPARGLGGTVGLSWVF